MDADKKNRQVLPYVIVAVLGLALCAFVACSQSGGGGGKAQAPASSSSKNTTSSNAASTVSSSRMKGEYASMVPKGGADRSALKEQIESLFSTYRGTQEVACIFLTNGGGSFSINGSDPILSASLLKLPILACLFEEVAQGELSLSSTYTIDADDIVGGTGTGLRAGQELTLERLAELMISESDNTAANTIISILGKDTLNAFFKAEGLTRTYLDHKFMAPNTTGDNLTSADDIAAVLYAIAVGDMGNAKLSELAQKFLREQADDEAMAQAIPSGFSLGNKSGTLSASRHDGGIIYGNDERPACVLVVMTDKMDEADSNRLIQKITAVVCETL